MFQNAVPFTMGLKENYPTCAYAMSDWVIIPHRFWSSILATYQQEDCVILQVFFSFSLNSSRISESGHLAFSVALRFQSLQPMRTDVFLCRSNCHHSSSGCAEW
jgi:hypothetical protein